MEYWEFLLQKQGERTWQKIYKPSLEIEEGKYRVVSHSSRNNCDVEIRVTHLDTEAVPPKRRISKRSRRTNSQGLMVVIPYTYLKPGVWEFRCCGDIMSDLLGETWQEIVKLDILPSTNRKSLPSHPAIARESQTEEIENRQISPSTTVPSLRNTPIELSEAPEIESEEELSLFPPQPVTFVAENLPSLTEIETETSLEEKGISSASATSKTAEILIADSIASEESLKNAELDLDEISTNVETSYNNRSLHKEENSPGEISISSPSIEEKKLVNSVNESDFFWGETNSDDPEILTSETDSAKELSWLNDFEEMRTNDLESFTSEDSTNTEISSENELSWLSEIESNDVAEVSSESEKNLESQIDSTDDVASNNLTEISSENELSWLSEIESNDVAEVSSELEKNLESQIDSTDDVASNNLTEISSENELSWLSEIESNDDESNAIAENLAQTDIDLTDKDESELGEETENDELVDSDIFWEETKQNNPTTTANSLIEKSVQDLEEILQQTVEPLLAELKEPPNDSLETITDIETIKDAETDVELHLSLTEEIFVRNQLGNLAIAGSIDTVEETAAASSFTLTGKLIFQLRDPQSNEILLEKERALVEKSLPFSFSDRLEIPPECQTRLILGEVILQSSSGVILASKIFTVTADVQELLKIFNQENSDRATEKQMQLVESSLPKQKKAVALREDFIQLAKKSEQVKSTKRSSGQIIPPKIGRSIAEEKTFKSLRLPNFGKPLALKVNTDPDTETSVVLNLEQLQDSVHQAIGKTNGNGNNKIADSTAVEDSSEKSLEIALTKDTKDDIEEKQEIIGDAIAHAEPTSEFDSTDSEQPEIAEPVSQTSSKNQEVTDSNNLKNELDQEDLFDFSSQPEAKSSEIVVENDEISRDESFNENIFAEDFTDFPAEEISNETSSEKSANEDNTDLWFSDESRNVEDEFKALKMQERFFSRLNSLATDIEGRELLPSESPEEDNEPAEEELASSVETEIEDFSLDFTSDIPDTEEQEKEINSDQQKIEEEIINLTEETPELATEEIEAEISSEEPPNEVVIDETTDEIVIETEDEIDLRNNTTAVDTSGLPYPAEVTQILPKSAIFSQPQWKGEVPTPQLSISETELIPGEPMRVRVKLSSYPGSVYIKLWIKDRQTRTLLDGPHALVDLITNRFSELETIAQMKVPLGSMEISVEAIAISPETQRESHKAILNHVVLPPDELDFSFDDF